MGITGLIPFLKKSSAAINLSQFQNQCAAVDAYSWLHKGAFSCADKLVKGEPTSGYIFYVLKQVNLLLSFNIKPILVFDGCHLPAKAVTELKRRENREKNRRKAKELLREGKTKEAQECFQRCVDITSAMAHEVIKACRKRNIDVIVAPYEADAELAYLNIMKIADFVITEDSDLIVFGCSKVVFKLDQNGGGLLIERYKLHLSMGLSAQKFNFDTFRNMCVLSGCDYLPSLHGIGLAKARKFFQLTTITDVFNALTRLPSYLKMPQLDVTLEYREAFIRALNTIQHQLVFDPATSELKPLNAYPLDFSHSDFPYCGKFMGHERALQIALGNVDVQTGETVDHFQPGITTLPLPQSSDWKSKAASHPSIWQENYCPDAIRKKPATYSPPRALNATAGRSITVDVHFNKRRLEEANEHDEMTLSDIDVTKLYKVPKLSLDEPNYAYPESDPSEPRSPTLPSRRSNPFAKSPPNGSVAVSSSGAKVFSGLKNFNTDASSTKTIVRSRFFSSSASDSKPKLTTILQKLDDIDSNEPSGNNRTTVRKLSYESTEAEKQESSTDKSAITEANMANDGPSARSPLRRSADETGNIEANTTNIEPSDRSPFRKSAAETVITEADRTTINPSSRNPFRKSAGPSFSWKAASAVNGSQAPSFTGSNPISAPLPDSPPRTQPGGKENSLSPKKQRRTSIYFGSVLTPPSSGLSQEANFKSEPYKKSINQEKAKKPRTTKTSCRYPGLATGKKQLSIGDMFAFKK